MRWTRSSKSFEVVSTIENTDLFFRCSTPMNDGSILFACWERFTDDHYLFSYRMGEPIALVGCVKDTHVYGLSQAVDGQIYAVGFGEIHALTGPE